MAVLILESPALDSWVARWGSDRSSFDTAVRRVSRPAPFVPTIEAPLFTEAPSAATLAVRARVGEPVADRSRQRLFVSAVAVVVCLTMALGYLAVRDVSRELRTAAVRSSFVAAVTHELKTPLASIRLLAETLRRGRARPEATDELLGTIVEETDRLARLVDNVLSSSRIESGTRSYHPQVVSLRDVVTSALRRFEYVLRQEQFVLTEQFEVAPLLVRADPDALEQAVMNLLGNAIKYSSGSREIRVDIVCRADNAVVSVADRGIGIAPRDRERIFESFYRASDAARDTTGAGLGLTLVKHFADAHHGRVTVDSEPGKGSVFSIVLPLADGPLVAAPSFAMPKESRHG
jgi:two-component system phosphate regulon sensor histidine kinase PhoR